MLKILQISDLHILSDKSAEMHGVNTDFSFRQVLAQAHALHGAFDLLLVTGDLAEHPCAASYERIVLHLQPYKTTTLCLPGNHDDFAVMQTVLNNGLLTCRKHMVFAASNWQIICLNSQKPGSPAGELAADELQFLQTCLTSKPDLSTLIAVHHHCFDSGSWMDTMQLNNYEDLLALISQHSQVKAVTFGHVHQIMETELNGVKLFSTPSTCFQFKPQAAEFTLDYLPPAYRILELGADGSFKTACYRITETSRAQIAD